MPIIPRADTDITRIGGLPGVRNNVRVSDRPAQALAEGVDALAGAAAKIGQKMQDRADTAAYMEAQRKLSDWRNGWYDPNNEAGIGAYKGRDALKLGDAMLPDFDRTVDEIGKGLPSQRAREKFMEFAQGERDQTTREVNRYATAQNDAYIASERRAFMESAANDLVRAQLSDPDEYKRRLASTLDTIYAGAVTDGEPPAETRLRVARLQSAVHSGVLDQLQTKDPIAASQYYAEHADEMQEADRARALRTIQPLLDDAQGEADASWAIGGNPVNAHDASSASVQAAYADIGARHGFRTTSTTRTKAENAAVGGVASSQHLDTIGTARDWSVKGKTPAEIKAFADDLRAQGFEVITKTHGTGPHVHAELPRQRLAALPPTTSEADALERVQSITDPARRKVAEAKVRDAFQIKRLREQEADRDAAEQINTAVWMGDPNKPLKELLGPDGYAHAARKGWIGALENDLKYRRESPTRTDNAEVVGAYLTAFRENPNAFARMDVMKNARHMSDETAKRLVKLQGEVRDGKYDVADVSTENDQLNALVFGPLNMVGETAEAKKRRAGFEAQWDALKLDWARRNPGKELDTDTRDKLIRRLRVAYAISGGKGFDRFAPTASQRQQAMNWLREKRGIPNPTDEQVNRVILLASGNG